MISYHIALSITSIVEQKLEHHDSITEASLSKYYGLGEAVVHTAAVFLQILQSEVRSCSIGFILVLYFPNNVYSSAWVGNHEAVSTFSKLPVPLGDANWERRFYIIFLF